MYDNYPTYLTKSSVNSPINFKKSPQKYAVYESPSHQQKQEEKTASSQRWKQWNPQTDYRNVKKIPQEYSNLRQTFDSRTNSRLQQKLLKYDFNDDEKPKEQAKINNLLRQTFHSKISSPPKVLLTQSSALDRVYTKQDPLTSSLRLDEPRMINSQRNTQNMDKIKKYMEVVEKFKEQNQNNSKMSQQIKRLRQDRRKRLQKERQEQKDAQNFKKKNFYEYYTPKNDKGSYHERFHALKINTTSFNENNQKNSNSQKTIKEYQSPISAKFTRPPKVQRELQQVHSARVIPRKLSQISIGKVKIDDFILGKNLGQGKFGVVYQAIHKQNGCIFAIKKIPKDMIKSHLMVDQFILQLKLQTFLNHQNILSIFTHFDDQTSLYLVLEYMEEGTLFSHLKKNKTLPEAEVAIKIKQVASAVKYLHKDNIVHRDIKPQNIVMSHGICKLCDFGWATVCDDRRTTICGTCDYIPPQILLGEQYDVTADLWCLGILTFQLLAGRTPFYHISRKQTTKKILNVQKTRIEYPEGISKTAISFIESLVKKNPNERMSSNVILKHPFLKNAEEKN